MNTEQVYIEWLVGSSLRKLGSKYGVSQTTIWNKLRRKYGETATNPRIRSLSRIVAQEYPEYLPNVLEVESDKLLTERAISSYSRYETVVEPKYLDRLTYSEPDRETFLNWVMFRYLIDKLVIILGFIYGEATKERETEACTSSQHLVRYTI